MTDQVGESYFLLHQIKNTVQEYREGLGKRGMTRFVSEWWHYGAYNFNYQINTENPCAVIFPLPSWERP